MSRFRVNMRLFYTKLVSLGLVLGLYLSLSAQAAHLPDFTTLIEQNAATVVNISTRSAKKSKETAIRIPGIREDGPLSDLFRRFLEEEGQNREAPNKGKIIDTHENYPIN
jgi:S1-C subfamily serine protease